MSINLYPKYFTFYVHNMRIPVLLTLVNAKKYKQLLEARRSLSNRSVNIFNLLVELESEVGEGSSQGLEQLKEDLEALQTALMAIGLSRSERKLLSNMEKSWPMF
jgi:hypothetical protein